MVNANQRACNDHKENDMYVYSQAMNNNPRLIITEDPFKENPYI
jgi:hypothetical protein